MSGQAGIIFGKRGFGCTTIDGATILDHNLEAPANLGTRGEILDWVLVEAQRLFVQFDKPTVRLQKAGGGGTFGASAERHEVEGVVLLAAFRAGSECAMLTTEGVRAALGVPRASGAYKALLARPDVRARSNLSRRHQFLLARAAQ